MVPSQATNTTPPCYIHIQQPKIRNRAPGKDCAVVSQATEEAQMTIAGYPQILDRIPVAFEATGECSPLETRLSIVCIRGNHSPVVRIL